MKTQTTKEIRKKDEALFEEVRKLQQNRASDYNALYELSQKYIYKIIHDIVKDPYTTEDMTQETYLQIYNKIGTLESPEAFYVWAGRIATNLTLRYIQKNRHEVLAGADENGDTDFVFDRVTEDTEQFIPETVLMNREKQRLIGEILDSLSPEQKICVQFFYFEEMSVREIAAAMHCSEGTVKSRLSYARKALKEAVLDMEARKGTRLYSLAALPLFWIVFRRAVEGVVTGAVTGAAAASAAGGAARAATAGGGAAGAQAAGGAAMAGAETAAAAGGMAVPSGSMAATGGMAAPAGGMAAGSGGVTASAGGMAVPTGGVAAGAGGMAASAGSGMAASSSAVTGARNTRVTTASAGQPASSPAWRATAGNGRYAGKNRKAAMIIGIVALVGLVVAISVILLTRGGAPEVAPPEMPEEMAEEDIFPDLLPAEEEEETAANDVAGGIEFTDAEEEDPAPVSGQAVTLDVALTGFGTAAGEIEYSYSGMVTDWGLIMMDLTSDSLSEKLKNMVDFSTVSEAPPFYELDEGASYINYMICTAFSGGPHIQPLGKDDARAIVGDEVTFSAEGKTYRFVVDYGSPMNLMYGGGRRSLEVTETVQNGRVVDNTGNDRLEDSMLAAGFVLSGTMWLVE